MLGVYFHWPYCLSKCIYCDFGSIILDKHIDFQALQSDYLECCKRQLSYFLTKIRNIEHISSIYFGGGTPSILDAKIIKELINSVKQEFTITNDCEITIEANPTSSNEEKFINFADAGVNRISIGVQSFNNKYLSFLGRKHNIEEAIKTIENAKKIFKRYTFDLIYALPNQDISQWGKELKQALSLEATHLSLYTLIIDDDTLLGQMVKKGIIKPKTENEIDMFYDFTNKFIREKTKLKQYEVSNYALKGFESKHNLLYWNSDNFIGIGPGAHGRLFYKDNNRYEIKNIFNQNNWINNILIQKTNGIEIEKPLSKKEQCEEILLMGLRTIEGIQISRIKQIFNIDIFEFINKNYFNNLVKTGFILFDENNNNVKLSYKGLKILDFIINKILI